MRPILFEHGDFVIPTFYLMMVVASIVGTYIVYYFCKKEGLSRVVALDVGMIGTITGIIGARIFHIVIEYPWYYLEHPTYTWQIWRGGLVWYGGMIVATFSIIGYLRWRKQPILPYLDILAISICAVLFFGRVGCFSVGCCYGQPTHLPWALIFPPYSEAGRQFPGIPLHPTQLYEMTSMVGLFLIGVYVENRKKFYGQTAWIILILYAIARGVIEIFRGDSDRGIFTGGLSTSQIIGILNIGVGIVLYVYCRNRFPVTPHRPESPVPQASGAPLQP